MTSSPEQTFVQGSSHIWRIASLPAALLDAVRFSTAYSAAHQRPALHPNLSAPYISIPMLEASLKQKVIQKFKTHATDTGSPQIQIALLSAEINELIKHLQTHKKDHSSRRGLIKKVGERRRQMKYLKREDAKAYDELMAKLGNNA
jgi:small subunit ribosomal protein S15